MPPAKPQSFNVQAFRVKGRGIEPEESKSARDEAHARRLGERLATSKAGVVVFRQDGDPRLGELEEPVILAVHGRVPPIYQDLPF